MLLTRSAQPLPPRRFTVTLTWQLCVELDLRFRALRATLAFRYIPHWSSSWSSLPLLCRVLLERSLCGEKERCDCFSAAV